MKKLLSLLLVFTFLFSLTACGPYSDEEVNPILDALLIKEAELNGYLYFDSFKTKEEPTEDDLNSPYQHYYLVHPESKYVTMNALKGAVDALYAESVREGIYEHAFDGFDDGEQVSRPPRFYEDKEGLKINVSDDPYSGRTLALLGSAEVLRSNKTHILAEITTYQFRNGKPMIDKKKIEILYEDGAWKLMGQTMIVGTTTEKLIEE